MLCPTLCGRIGKGTDPIVFQSHALHFQKTGLAVFGKGEVKPACAKGAFRFQVGDLPQTTFFQPTFHRLIGGLGIHIDEQIALLNCDQIIPGLPGVTLGIQAPNLSTNGEQFSATAGVFHMANFLFAVNFNVGNKPVGPLQKHPRLHFSIVMQNSTSFFSIIPHPGQKKRIKNKPPVWAACSHTNIEKITVLRYNRKEWFFKEMRQCTRKKPSHGF